jgi:hypothetical protein
VLGAVHTTESPADADSDPAAACQVNDTESLSASVAAALSVLVPFSATVSGDAVKLLIWGGWFAF